MHKFIKKAFILTFFISTFSHTAFAESATSNLLFEVENIYNHNEALEMDVKSQTPYLTYIQKNQDGSKSLHLYSLNENLNDSNHHIASNSVINPIQLDATDDPAQTHLAIGTYQDKPIQYIGYIDKSKNNLLTIYQFYPNLETKILTVTLPMAGVNAMDMVALKDGHLIVALVLRDNTVHLWNFTPTIIKNCTPFAPSELTNANHLELVPNVKANHFKLALVNDVPYLSYISNGEIFVQYIKYGTNTSQWVTLAKTPVNTNIDGSKWGSDNTLSIIPVDNSDHIYIALQNQFKSLSIKTGSWDASSVITLFYNHLDVAEIRSPSLATDGKSIYGIYPTTLFEVSGGGGDGADEKFYTREIGFAKLSENGNLNNTFNYGRIERARRINKAHKGWDSYADHLVMHTESTYYYKGLGLYGTVSPDDSRDTLRVKGIHIQP